ncbi:hemin uptake protein HemP [Rhizobium tubonense]|uniref:Hemin uptake protein HemP n=1 Tax=Rhizobium tubonense TaxID=484088 RepID=A0A2W4EJU2_9HYPH|nr:hemin uptake protein HemP [Rhizobium tubonense]PZM14156.1 hemin uptake protein HemP [Rhizobium tubonense]
MTEQNKRPEHQVTPARIVESADVFRGQSEVMIRHEGAIYRLKITRQGKLILNK